MALGDDLCSRFCAYYKPAKGEELACRGFSVVERMIKGGRKLPFEIQEGAIGADIAAGLELRLCRRCPFYREDCDFAAGAGAPPCGGYLFIGRLVGRGALLLDDLDEMD
ncbi:MAG: hypothetical protein M0Z60_00875 [Nitrospiraceae bacterium]|nr:hypothetical protein [Nitrospiraceae bacterium]